MPPEDFSTENPVQEPAGITVTIPEHPQTRTLWIGGDKIISRDAIIVPPARFETFRPVEEFERACPGLLCHLGVVIVARGIGERVPDVAVNQVLADVFDERDEAVKIMLEMTISACRKANKYVGICGQGPSDHPDLARWLVNQEIESMSLNPDTVVETWMFLAGKSV